MNYKKINDQCIPKKIQGVLEKRNLWPSGGLNLECPQSKCFNCQVAAECKICIKGHKCELCKIPRQHSGTATCTKNRRYNACAIEKKIVNVWKKILHHLYNQKGEMCRL